jgi:hypothetical protein
MMEAVTSALRREIYKLINDYLKRLFFVVFKLLVANF